MCVQGNLVRRVDAVVRNVHWSEGGTQVAVLSDDSFYLLQYNANVVDAALAGECVCFSAKTVNDSSTCCSTTRMWWTLHWQVNACV